MPSYVTYWNSIGEGFAVMVVGLALPIIDTWCSNAYDAFLLWMPDSQYSFSFETNEVANPSTWLEEGF